MTKKEFIDLIEIYPNDAEMRVFNGDYWKTGKIFSIDFDKFEDAIIINDRR